MVGKRFLRTERGERIDQPDFQHAVEVSQRDAVAQIVDKFLVGEDNSDATIQPRSWIIKDFATAAIGLNVTINNGVALLGFRDRGQVQFGCLEASGDTSKTINMSNFADGTYGIFIRFEFRDEDFVNRLFWNPNAAPPTEFPRNIPTRRAENWSVAIELLSPGSEWLRIADAAKAAGVITLTDQRDFFFEGKSSNNFLAVDSEWGGGSDRSITRSNNGVFGLYRATRGLQRQVQDIIGGAFPFHGWWSTVGTGGSRSLVQLVNEKLARDGNQSMEGDLLSDTNARSIGISGARWGTAFFQGVVSSGGKNPRTDLTFDIGTTILRWLNIFGRNHVSDVVDGHRFQTPVTCHHWISGDEFQQRHSNPTSETEYTRDTASPIAVVDYGALLLQPSAGTNPVGAKASIKLPQSAVITSVVLHGFSNTSVNAFLGIIRQTHDGNAGTRVESLLSTAVPAGVNPNPFPVVTLPIFGAATPFSVPVDQNLTIDNATYKYVINLYATGTTAQLGVRSVLVTYTLPALRPA